MGSVSNPPTPVTDPAPRTFAPMPRPVAWWERIPAPVVTLATLTLGLLTLCLLIPVPYAVRQPGPTVDTLGESGDTPLISIPDAETFPTAGELRLTTVSVAGGPGYPVGLTQVVQGWLDPRTTVVPRESVFPPDQTQEESAEQSQAQMTSSQENATAAALEALGYDVTATLEIAGVIDGGASASVAQEGDVITGLTVDGEAHAIDSFTALSDLLEATPPGTDVTLVVDRDGTSTDLAITTGDDGEGGSVLGVLVDPTFDFPVEVDIEIANIGGPSAGTMFALGIMEKLTEGDQTGGQVIAGTGTIDMTGDVGAIGGIVQKMYGSVRDGAHYFLAPESNCADVVGNVPDGLQVVSVATLEDAWTAVQAIGAGTAEDLPTCS